MHEFIVPFTSTILVLFAMNYVLKSIFKFPHIGDYEMDGQIDRVNTVCMENDRGR